MEPYDIRGRGCIGSISKTLNFDDRLSVLHTIERLVRYLFTSDTRVLYNFVKICGTCQAAIVARGVEYRDRRLCAYRCTFRRVLIRDK